MKWMVEEGRLGDDQKDIIKEANKAAGEPIWIQGYAGSGKSVVLLHVMSEYLIRNKTANVAVVVFTKALVDLIRTGLNQIPAISDRHIPVFTIYQMDRNLTNQNTYDAIFCDEVQDLPIELIKKMKAGCKQLIIAGDSAQSIYSSVPGWGTPTASSSLVISEIKPIVKKSTTIYRLTSNVIGLIKKVFPDIANGRTLIGQENPDIRLFKFTPREKDKDEVAFTWDEFDMANTTRPEEINAILIFRRAKILEYCQRVLEYLGKPQWEIQRNTYNKIDFNSLNNHLNNHGIPLMYVGSGFGSLATADEQNKIVIMTYHSVKGLDFDAICLPYLSEDIGFTDNVKALMLVALSRAKRDLLITYTDNMYTGFQSFLDGIPLMDPPNESSNTDELKF